jgi:ATP-dependent Lhr-like helicase
MIGIREATRRLGDWMASEGATPLPFQRETWRAWRAGESGLIHAPTGSGKTLAVWGGALIDAMMMPPTSLSRRGKAKDHGPRLIWITPLRALATDTVGNLQRPLAALGLDLHVVARTGDSSQADRRRARQGRVDALVTTPESLSLLLSHADARDRFSRLTAIVVDEWHELLGSKRGVQLELCLSRLRTLAPSLRTWALSATLGNPVQALDVLLGHANGRIISGNVARRIDIETLLPATVERFPWAGHLGLSQLPRVLDAIMRVERTIVFTNTRSQAELWHRALVSVWPESPDTIALHHGSLEQTIRQRVEAGLRERQLRCVVATSSLDLGVDFPAVEQVIQIGSPKGIARLLQRAGRSNHTPGQPSRVLCVPTHALEVAEIAAARRAIAAGTVEPRVPLTAPLDVLAQHLTTLAVADGFAPAQALAEIRTTHAYRDIDEIRYGAVLAFLRQGGASLHAYPEYRRLVVDDTGRYRPADARIARLHRYAIGTITSDGSLSVRYRQGARLGSIEEGFLARLKPGEAFLFAGRLLELVRIRDMTAYVKPATQAKGTVAVWQGSRMPLSTELAGETAALLAVPDHSQEMRWLGNLLELQGERSVIPGARDLLAELHRTRDGEHLVLFPFAGRLAHEGLAALVAFRLGKLAGGGYRYAVNDYGLIVGARHLPPIDEKVLRGLIAPEGLLDMLDEAMALAELARRRFRDIARVSGLIMPSRPGAERSLRQLQTSAGLLFDVLSRHEPDHVLVMQARREVLEQELEIGRLHDTLLDCATRRMRLTRPGRLTPFAFPLWAERMRGKLSFDDWQTRARQLAEHLERAA